MQRDAYFDNAKVLLIFLVVFGHMIQPFVDDSLYVQTLYLWIYTFSMPAFIFLSGFFAKGAGTISYVIQLAKKLLLPYMIFQILYSGYYYVIGKSSWQTGLFYPHWSLWFLFSLFSWHLLLNLFKRLPVAWSISIAILIGLLIGYYGDVGHAFSLSRTFVFFPFFLTGYWISKKQLMYFKRPQVKVASIFILSIVGIMIHFAPTLNSGWLLASKSYVDLGMPTFGGLARLLVYATSTLMSISVLAWIPTRKLAISYLGTRTLYVYLLHGLDRKSVV